MWVAVPVAIVVLLLLRVLANRFAPILRNRQLYDVKEFPAFLTNEECSHLIETARPVLKKSTVTLQGQSGQNDKGRTSDSAFLDHDGDAILTGIKGRIAELTATDVRQQEGIQVTHYEAGQSFGNHYDALISNGLDPGVMGDRILTVILYLNDDYEGGATYFPKIAQRIQPQKGKAVLFSNMNADGQSFNPLSVHAGEVVRSGEKWLVNQWIRQRPANRAQRRAQSPHKSPKQNRARR